MANEVKPKKQAVKYFFPKSAKKSYQTTTFRVKAEDHIFILDPADKNYAAIKKYLQGHKENAENGGRVFTQISNDAGKDTDRGKAIDKLLLLDEAQLRRICGDDIELALVTSKGQLIDIYLKQQDM